MLLLYYLLPLPVLLGTFLYVRRRFDTAMIALLFAALALCYFHFYRSSWHEFTPDAQAHAEYVRLLAQNPWQMPAVKATAATRHPPTYYAAAAVLYRIGEHQDTLDPLMFARHLSMALYAVFLVAGLLIIRLVLRPPSASYYCAAAIFLFWPIGITLGGRVVCDLLLYAGEIGALFCMAHWLLEKDLASLSGAFLWAGFAVLAKNMGIVVLGMSGWLLFIAFYEHRLTWRRFLRHDLILSVAFALISCFLTLTRTFVTTGIEKLPPYWHEWWQMVSSFSPYLLLFDTEMFDSEGKFLNMLLHSLLLGDPTQPWKSFDIPLILLAFNIIWVAIMLYVTIGTVMAARSIRQREGRVLALMGSYGLIVVSLMLYMILITNNLAYGDARYVYPAVTGIALLHGCVMDWHLAAGRKDVWRIGLGLAVTFCCLTVILFLVQHLPVQGMNCHHFPSPEHC